MVDPDLAATDPRLISKALAALVLVALISCGGSGESDALGDTTHMQGEDQADVATADMPGVDTSVVLDAAPDTIAAKWKDREPDAEAIDCLTLTPCTELSCPEDYWISAVSSCEAWGGIKVCVCVGKKIIF